MSIQGVLYKVGVFWLTGLVLFVSGMVSGQPDVSCSVTSRFQTVLDSLCSFYDVPGATAAMILPDGTVQAVASGFADVESAVPMTPDSRMLAASIGKSFVAATVLALVQENKLSLDAPISTWLGDRPWFSRLAHHDRITLRQLLNHTSGIANHVEQDAFARDLRMRWRQPENPFTPEELISYILNLPSRFEPGDGWAYSDTGYILVGLIIETVTGQSYEQEVTRRFLNPLALTLTEASDQRQLNGLAAGYLSAENVFGLPEKTTVSEGVMAWHPGIEWTGGGLVSNPKDLVRWAKALFEGHALSGSYLEDLLQRIPVSSDRPGVFYGLGITIRENGSPEPVYGHRGWIPGTVSSMCYYPQQKSAIAIQINTDVGMLGASSRVLESIETQLARVVLDSR
jgi:D-alanyl-D-alanine carboxypeptidase